MTKIIGGSNNKMQELADLIGVRLVEVLWDR